MYKHLKLVFISSVFALLAISAAASTENVWATLKVKPGLRFVTENAGSFTVFVPTVNEHTMIVALHGSGERSQGYIKNWLKEAALHNYFVVAIDSHDPVGWSQGDIWYILGKTRDLSKKFRARKILLSGASSGGQFALILGINYNRDFDAVATFMGTLYGDNKLIEYPPPTEYKLPFYLVHGDQDKILPAILGDITAKRLESLGYSVTFSRIPKMDHRHWRLENEKIIKWFEKVTAN